MGDREALGQHVAGGQKTQCYALLC